VRTCAEIAKSHPPDNRIAQPHGTVESWTFFGAAHGQLQIGRAARDGIGAQQTAKVAQWHTIRVHCPLHHTARGDRTVQRNASGVGVL